MANRVIALMSKMLNLAIRWQWVERNEAGFVERNPEQPRERFLADREYGQLLRAIGASKNVLAAKAIHLLLLTGARRSEVLSARWDQFDLEKGVWRKPAATTKQNRLHQVPLSQEAVELICSLPRDGEQPHLFPSGSKVGHLTDVKKTWGAIRREAGIGDMRLHDLRHAFASTVVSSGYSLPVVGALLGHTQPQTTARYAHLVDDKLREATNRAAGSIQNHAALHKPDEELWEHHHGQRS
jgi:integrase